MAIIIAIMSMPEVLEPLAKYIVKSMGPYWLIAVLIVGVIHGLKPDEHTWPITVTYGLMQRNVGGVIAAVSVFAGALTLVWTLMSALIGELMGLLNTSILDPYVDIIVGLTMIGVAAYLVFGRHGDYHDVKTADYKLIWIHGLAAAFGGDFFIVLILTIAIVPMITTDLSFLVGFMFGFGSWLAQTVIVLAIYKGVIKSVGDWSVVAEAGRIALGILGLFMIGLGIYSFFTPSD
ncbi:conserved hypothetical protein [Vulcanisaeta distributa DSM 14429]|uniref:Uncharacterized protein n=2 Tax=Vulcanisaeta distributa TaxID=164451 RepID=E1QSI1_VULDI|nr:hypothetical protein [Vulcanisaeta distributa]ADN50774.1 conserved hypothetical protein [Vulcanisaeta distributa DSM 14429]